MASQGGSFQITTKIEGEKVMKVLICGSRTISDSAVVLKAVAQSGIRPTHIISGGARGVDRLASQYAASHGIEFTEYLANWNKYGKRAGFVRNYVMVGAAEAVIAVWDGTSRGTNTRSSMRDHAGNGSLFTCTRSEEQNLRQPRISGDGFLL